MPNSAAIITLLQIAGSLLMGVQNNPKIPDNITRQAIALSSQAIQQAVQLKVTPEITFPTPKNSGIWPTIGEVYTAAYLGAQGTYVPLSPAMALIPGDTSFGDMNGDGSDDAAAVIQLTDGAGNKTFSLAALLNQNGDMFNIADAALGSNVQVLSHDIENGNIVLHMQTGSQPAVTSTYDLLGDRLFKE